MARDGGAEAKNQPVHHEPQSLLDLLLGAKSVLAALHLPGLPWLCLSEHNLHLTLLFQRLSLISDRAGGDERLPKLFGPELACPHFSPSPVVLRSVLWVGELPHKCNSPKGFGF